MKLLMHTVSLIFIAAIFWGCDKKSSGGSLSETKWQLKGYVTAESQGMRKTKAESSEAYMLEFMDNIQTYGWGEKNSIGGKYKTSGPSISFKELISTQRKTQFEDETIFFNIIENATEYIIDNQELYLFSDQKKSYLVFKKL